MEAPNRPEAMGAGACAPADASNVDPAPGATPASKAYARKPRRHITRLQTQVDPAIVASDEFRMYCYKVVPCSVREPHEWTTCPFCHPGEMATRRCPQRFKYAALACPDLKNGCPREENCMFAHSLFEYWLHPTRYHTQLCSYGSQCRRSICFFAHHCQELRDSEELVQLQAVERELGLDPGSGFHAGHGSRWKRPPKAAAGSKFSASQQQLSTQHSAAQQHALGDQLAALQMKSSPQQIRQQHQKQVSRGHASLDFNLTPRGSLPTGFMLPTHDYTPGVQQLGALSTSWSQPGASMQSHSSQPQVDEPASQSLSTHDLNLQMATVMNLLTHWSSPRDGQLESQQHQKHGANNLGETAALLQQPAQQQQQQQLQHQLGSPTSPWSMGTSSSCPPDASSKQQAWFDSMSVLMSAGLGGADRCSDGSISRIVRSFSQDKGIQKSVTQNSSTNSLGMASTTDSFCSSSVLFPEPCLSNSQRSSPPPVDCSLSPSHSLADMDEQCRSVGAIGTPPRHLNSDPNLQPFLSAQLLNQISQGLSAANMPFLVGAANILNGGELTLSVSDLIHSLLQLAEGPSMADLESGVEYLEKQLNKLSRRASFKLPSVASMNDLCL